MQRVCREKSDYTDLPYYIYFLLDKSFKTVKYRLSTFCLLRTLYLHHILSSSHNLSSSHFVFTQSIFITLYLHCTSFVFITLFIFIFLTWSNRASLRLTMSFFECLITPPYRSRAFNTESVFVDEDTFVLSLFLGSLCMFFNYCLIETK